MASYPLSTDKTLSNLSDLRDRKLLCDVHLVAGSRTFSAHKVVLAAASPYFEAMFTGGFKESNMDSVTMEETNPDGLEAVLNAMYSDKVTLHEESLDNVLYVAGLLQLNEITQACEKFMTDTLNTKTCVRYFCICDKFNLHKALQSITSFMKEEFEAVVETNELKHISKEALCRFLSDDELRIPSGEIMIFRAAVQWLRGNLYEVPESEAVKEDEKEPRDADSDEVDVVEILKLVRFPFIPPDTLIDEVMQEPLVHTKKINSSLEPSSQGNKVCMSLVAEALRFHCHPFMQPKHVGDQYVPRGTQKLLIIPCGTREIGYAIEEPNLQIHLLDLNSSPFTCHESVLEFPFPFAFRSMSAVTRGNYLFLFGTDNKSFNPAALRYDVTSGTWFNLKAPPRQATIGSSAAILGDDIYLTGGMLVTKDCGALDPRCFTDKTLRYSIGSNSWTELCDMPHGVTYHATISKGDAVFAAGGYIGLPLTETTDALFVFDAQNEWNVRASMHHSRYQFSLANLGDHLYACGGRSRDYNSGETSVERYDVLQDQWTILEDFTLKHCVSPYAVETGSKLYILGGREMSSEGRWFDSNSISCIDDDALRHAGNLPFSIARHVCAVLTVPRT